MAWAQGEDGHSRWRFRWMPLGETITPEPLHGLEVERRYVRHVLTAVHGNKTLAARMLGFDRTTLYRKLAQYDIREP